MKLKEKCRAAGVSRLLLMICAELALLAFAAPATADAQQAPPNQLVIELFVRPNSDQCQRAEEFLKDLSERRKGIEVKIHDVTTDREALARLWKLAKQFGKEKAELPSVYFCNSFKVGFRDAETTGKNIESYLTIRAFVRTDCPHCEDAKAYLRQFSERWPAIKIEYLNVVEDANAREEFEKLTETFKKKIVSFPCLQVAGRLLVGFQSDETTGKQIEDFFQDRSKGDLEEGTGSGSGESKEESSSEKQSRRLVPRVPGTIASFFATKIPAILNVAWQASNPAESPSGENSKKKMTS